MKKLMFYVTLTGLAATTAIHGENITWTAQFPASDMNDPANWSTGTLPSGTDTAIFDTRFSNSTNPTEAVAPFSVYAIEFNNGASSFDLQFNNQPLTFTGSGIVGNQTNASININNNNGIYIPYQLSFTGTTINSSSGSSLLTVSNNADEPEKGGVNHQIQSDSPFTIESNGIVSVSNSGTSTLAGVGNNCAGISDSQLYFGAGLTAQDHVNLEISNHGSFTEGITDGNFQLGRVGSHQFSATLGVHAGSYFNMNVSNSGTINNTNGGANSIAELAGSSQVDVTGPFTVGDNSTITIRNSGFCSGTMNSINQNTVAGLQDEQLHVTGTFHAGDNLVLNVINEGFDNTYGGGSNVAPITTSSTNKGMQIYFESGCQVGNNASIGLSNTGTYTGMNLSGTLPTANVAILNDGQFICAGPFSALDYLHMTATNSGFDSGIDNGVADSSSDAVGVTSNLQFLMSSTCNVGNYATISAFNAGDYSGTNLTRYSSVGGVNGQIGCVGNFEAGDSLNMRAFNSGRNGGNCPTVNYIGTILVEQIKFGGSCTLGDNANITMINFGENANYSLHGDVVGCVRNTNQCNAVGDFHTGDNLNFEVVNVGINYSLVGNGNYVGFINSNSIQFDANCHIGNNGTVSVFNVGLYGGTGTTNDHVGTVITQFNIGGQFTAEDNFTMQVLSLAEDGSQGSGGANVGVVTNQLLFGDSCSFGDDALISISNTGTYGGINTIEGNNVATVNTRQFKSQGTLSAGRNFNLSISNEGNCETISGSNHVGYVNGYQLQLMNGCTVGNDSTISVINSGSNNGTGTLNHIGYTGTSQAIINGNFIGGTNLRMEISNLASNGGDSNNLVGYVNGDQALFQNGLTIGDGSVLSVLNTGTVVGSQLILSDGFNINGKATIQAMNTGTIGGYGISILGGQGGNANIALTNTSLNISSSSTAFTIGELNGDGTSTVQSLPLLVINTSGASTVGEFAGVIQDYPSMTSALTKSGPGTQMLSGTNTYTGLTTVQEGILVLNGSVSGGMTISPLGILKGNGVVNGAVNNQGTISPGQSIGMLTFNDNFINNDGTYNVEVNGLGESDLIRVIGDAALNGGTVVFSSVDGTYLFQTPYTILTASTITGEYTQAIGAFPLLSANLSKDPTHVYVTLETNIAAGAKTHNQQAVAFNLDNIIMPNENQTLLLSAIINQSEAGVESSLNSLSGYQHTDDMWISEIQSRHFIRRLYDPLREIITTDPSCACVAFDCNPCGCCPDSNNWKGWIEGEYGYYGLNGNENAHKALVSTIQYTGGMQKTFCDDFTLGIAGNYERDHIHYKHGGTGKNQAWLAGLYGLYRPTCYYVLADIAYGQSFNKIKRSIDVGTLHYIASSKPKISHYIAYGEAGLDYSISCLLVQPFVGIETGRYERDHLKEKESHGWALAIHKKDLSLTSSRLGVHLTTSKILDCLGLSLDLAWNHLLSSDKNSIKGGFIDFGTDFNIDGINLNRDSIDYALTLSLGIGDIVNAYVEFSGESWNRATRYNIIGGLELEW